MSDAQVSPEELEKAYDQSKWAANMQDILARYRLLSDAARAVIGEPTRVAYGAGSDEGLDIYPADAQGAPVVVFVHGGGWRSGSAWEFAFPAQMLRAAGIHYVALDFSTIADAKGDLAVLVDQVRRALAWLHRNCSGFGGDAGRLYLVGHSSGAHLAAMALSTRWHEYGVCENPVSSGVLISGIYDLGPLRHTSRAKYVRIDDLAERKLSPLRQISCLQSPLLLAVGSKESPEFQRQAKEYTGAVAEAGNEARLVIGNTYNHFDIVETFGNPYGLLGRSLLDLVNSGGT